jgi:predicted AlkP superfamily pyrophosphatase or phosphodiesterase
VPGLYQKVVLVVIDGLRPDAVTPECMPVLSALMGRAWSAKSASTVRPSITVAALTSLGTGVSPARHGLRSASIGSLGRLRGLRPLPNELRRLGVETTIVVPELSGGPKWIAGALLRLAGATRLIMLPAAPGLLMDGAMRHMRGNPAQEFLVAYMNDADLAGHACGWMSQPYLRAAATIDRALTSLFPFIDDPEVLVIITADHGGGGVLAQDHDHPHPVNDAIPLLLLGGRVGPGIGAEGPAHLLDIPPTVLHGFGSAAPAQYEGRVIHEAYLTEYVWA